MKPSGRDHLKVVDVSALLDIAVYSARLLDDRSLSDMTKSLFFSHDRSTLPVASKHSKMQMFVRHSTRVVLD